MSKKRDRSRRKLGVPSSLGSLGRENRANSRSTRDVLLIVCEGLRTEPNYFNALRQDLKLPTVSVRIEGEGCAPITVVKRALEYRKERLDAAKAAARRGQLGDPPFDEVWCVFDTERVEQNASLYQALDTARSNSIKVAISNPAFEFWYLLHFRDTTQPFANARELELALKEFIPNYQKSSNVYPVLVNRTDVAIQRAKRILQDCQDDDQVPPNPSTMVCEIVDKLRSMGRK